ncbi:Glutamine--tRNA ligase (Gln-tRNA) [Candidatus Vidania fulgoroideae]|nr:Glutamine--tRNA ligase (Gln-tRNA) [Candidatus Vidania fulgoroideae]
MIENFSLKKIFKKKKIKTRFCPEPSGFLHIGHLKNFYINYLIAEKTKGEINIRIDDSNPEKIKKKYEKNIPIEIFKLNFKKRIKITKTSFYFIRMYKITKKFIKVGLAYVDSQKKNIFIERRGSYKKKGIDSCFRNRTVFENLYFLKKMKKGLFNLGENIVRLKIKMDSRNMYMRDPVIYRIKKDKKKKTIFPNYDFCNSICDRIERINYSICSKEFENNKKLYNFIINKYNDIYKKNHLCEQIELSRLDIEGEKLQKRKIKSLIKKKKIINWGDIRLLTLRGMRNKGYSNGVIKDIVKMTGFTKSNCKIKKEQLKDVIIRRMKKEVKKKVFVIFKPIKIKDIKKRDFFFVEKKKKIKFTYHLKNRLFFFLKKKRNIILCKSLLDKSKKRGESFLEKSKKNKSLKFYLIKDNKIISRYGFLNTKKLENKELIIINKIGFFKTIIKNGRFSFFEVESFPERKKYL